MRAVFVTTPQDCKLRAARGSFSRLPSAPPLGAEVKNFDLRREARSSEIDAILKAKAVLSVRC